MTAAVARRVSRAPAAMRRARVGIDVGGTFTDFVLSNGADGSLTYFKEPSVPSDPSLAVERGMAALLDRARLEPGDVELVVHGTTLGLNAIIQRRGAAMALVVSRGNRDVLEIARCRMPSSYDFSAPKEEPLVPRDLVFEIGARSAFDGTILARPPVEEIAELAETLKSRGVAAVAVMLLNAYVDPTSRPRLRTLSQAGCRACWSAGRARSGPRFANTSVRSSRGSTLISTRCWSATTRR